MYRVSILIPIYNSCGIIETTVRRLVDVLSKRGYDFEIILRDDGSRDESKYVMDKLPQIFPQVKCFFNQSNRGLGYTLRSMFKDCNGKSIVYCDCDLPFGVKIIPIMVSKLSDYDIVVASRYSGIPSKGRLGRKIFSRMYYMLCKLLFNIPVSDIGSGTVAIRKDVLDELILYSDGFDIHAEFYVSAADAGFSIKEIPASAEDNCAGSFSILYHSPTIIKGTFRLWAKRRIEKRRLLFFPYAK